MFYQLPSFEDKTSIKTGVESAIVTLNPPESKRLIAKAIAVLPEIQTVMRKGRLVISWGTTNAFVVEEIVKRSIPHKTDFASGVVCEGELNANHPETKIMPFVLQDGQITQMHQKAALREFKPGDVFIKGANALDAKGDIGILIAASTGGSISEAWLAINVCGGSFICPVGLEKLIPSAREAAKKCNMFRFHYSMGVPVSMVTFSTAKVVTEIQAIKVLTGADAYHVASGGIGGSEGAIMLVLEGQPDNLEHAFELVKSVKGEPSLSPPRKYITSRAASVNFDPLVLSEELHKALPFVP